MFSNFSNIDRNVTRDISKGENSNQTCTWFTIFLNMYEEIDDITDEVVRRYEYVSFPCTATNDSHIRFYTLDYPYVHGIPFGSSV